MNTLRRRIGLEQEFFLVDETGEISNLADEFLENCHINAPSQNLNPNYFVQECTKSMVEINTPPGHSATELAIEYLKNIRFAIAVAKEMRLRLYPLSSYPLHIMPVMRDQQNYHIQSRTLGYDRFLHAGKCTGTHLHLEIPPGIVDQRVLISYNSTLSEREELINIYNLATALDSALIALARACPFYEGVAIGLAAHTIRYRGSEKFGWEGVYTNLQPVGALMPYADSVESLVEQQFFRYHAWLQALDKAGVNRNLFYEAGGNILKSAWNPIRINRLGTVEIRCIDSNFPSVIIAMIALVEKAAHRVRNEGLKVLPNKDLRQFEVIGNCLYVPDFDFLNGDLLYAAATEGVKHPQVKTYIDSILEFATASLAVGIADGGEGQVYLNRLRQKLGQYETIESEILQKFTPATADLSREAGLSLVRQCCDELELQVAALTGDNPLEILDHQVDIFHPI
jgi:gamma-glutamyl:cysteine ligase YbdK (ATP-grasp superfamily)